MHKHNKLFILITSVIILFTSCTIITQQPGSGPDPIINETGSISGKATYSNASLHSNIIITVEEVLNNKSAGVIVSEKSLSPISKAAVAQSKTDAQGNYEIKDLPSGTYTIYASSQDSLEKALATDVTVESGKNVTLEDLILTATGSISGTVSVDNSTNGNGGCLVFIAGTSYMAMTDTTGAYTITGVPADKTYTMMVLKDGKTITGNSVTVRAHTNITADAISITTEQPTPEPEPQFGILKGQLFITNGSTEDSEGWIAFIPGTALMTPVSSAGVYEFENVPAGVNYVVTVLKDGDIYSGPIVTVEANSTVTVNDITIDKKTTPVVQVANESNTTKIAQELTTSIIKYIGDTLSDARYTYDTSGEKLQKADFYTQNGTKAVSFVFNYDQEGALTSLEGTLHHTFGLTSLGSFVGDIFKGAKCRAEFSSMPDAVYFYAYGEIGYEGSMGRTPAVSGLLKEGDINGSYIGMLTIPYMSSYVGTFAFNESENKFAGEAINSFDTYKYELSKDTNNSLTAHYTYLYEYKKTPLLDVSFSLNPGFYWSGLSLENYAAFTLEYNSDDMLHRINNFTDTNKTRLAYYTLLTYDLLHTNKTAAKRIYTPDDNLTNEDKYLFNADGNTTKYESNVYYADTGILSSTVITDYGPAGTVTQNASRNYNSDGNITVSDVLNYADNNRTRIEYTYTGTALSHYTAIDFTYLGSNYTGPNPWQVTKSTEYNANSDIIKEITYNSIGYPTLQKQYTYVNGVITYIEEWNYIEGSYYFLGHVKKDTEGTVLVETQYYSYSTSKSQEKVYTYLNGSVDYYWIYQYDFSGNQTSAIQYDANGTVIPQ